MNSRFRLRPRNRRSPSEEKVSFSPTPSSGLDVDNDVFFQPNDPSRRDDRKNRRMDEDATTIPADKGRGREPFWIQDPRALCMSFTILPSPEMTEAQRFNTMTRLILIITIFLFFIPLASWIIFLVCGIILLVIIYSLSSPRPKIDNYYCRFRKSAHKSQANPSPSVKTRSKFPPHQTEGTIGKRRRKFSIVSR